MSITIKDVAKRVGVTPATVSMVINHKPRISDETRRKVFEAIEELDYFPHAGARSLVLQRTRTVGVSAPLISGPAVQEVLAAIEEAAAASGYDLVLYGTGGPSMTEDLVLTRIARERKVDGLIMINQALSPKQLGYFQMNKVAVVSLDGDGEGCERLLADHQRGAYLAVQHLLSLGHRRIALLNGPASFAPARQRESGYRQALTEAKLTLNPGLILRVAATGREEGYDACDRLAQMPQMPTAVLVAAGDACAAGLLQALKKKGLQVPKQISVVGFDDQPVSELVEPALTTVRLPLARMAAEAFQSLLLAMRNADAPQHPKTRLFQAELVLRRSTAEAPSR
jgi:LacI family transcriptional regulator